jgi:hypothetical protein
MQIPYGLSSPSRGRFFLVKLEQFCAPSSYLEGGAQWISGRARFTVAEMPVVPERIGSIVCHDFTSTPPYPMCGETRRSDALAVNVASLSAGEGEMSQMTQHAVPTVTGAGRLTSTNTFFKNR